MLFPANHFIGTKIECKLNQTATELEHKQPKQQLQNYTLTTLNSMKPNGGCA